MKESERGLVQSGSVFVFDEHESGIKRWTDGLIWSPSRILGNFLIYRETDKPKRNSNQFQSNSYSLDDQFDQKSDDEDLTQVKERQLVGSLTKSDMFKNNGLVKKTMSLSYNGSAQHLISYYKVEDVQKGRLRTPSSLPEFQSLSISQEYLIKSNFRCPIRTELDPDGILRYRGENEDLSQYSPSNITSALPSNLKSRSRNNSVNSTDFKFRHGSRSPPKASPTSLNSHRFTPYSTSPPQRHSFPNPIPTPLHAVQTTTPTTSPPNTYSRSFHHSPYRPSNHFDYFHSPNPWQSHQHSHPHSHTSTTAAATTTPATSNNHFINDPRLNPTTTATTTTSPTNENQLSVHYLSSANEINHHRLNVNQMTNVNHNQQPTLTTATATTVQPQTQPHHFAPLIDLENHRHFIPHPFTNNETFQ